jgi:hypothetical protein
LSNYLRQVITLADYIYHKNEIGKPPRKEFALLKNDITASGSAFGIAGILQ